MPMRHITRASSTVISVVAAAALTATTAQGLAPSLTSHASKIESPAYGKARPHRAFPTPGGYFGFEMGAEGRLASYPKIVDYMKLAARNSDRVAYQRVGTTTEGHEYGVSFISSPRNLKNLRKLVRINQKLATGSLTESQARKLSRESVPFYLVQTTIHSTEVMNTQAVPDMVHHYVTDTSSAVTDDLDNAVLMVVPSQNPDGQYDVVDYFNQTAGTDYNRVYPDLYQKYTGHDDNRDWFMQTQKETRLFVGLVDKYKPVAVQQMHGQGPRGERIFVPPYGDPIDPTIHPRARQQVNATGMAMANALTQAGKTGVQWGNYDEWSPSLSYSFYHGAPAILSEIAAASNLAYTYKSPDGKPLGPQETYRSNLVAPYKKSTWTPRQAVEYAQTSVYAAFENVAKYHDTYLYGIYDIAKQNRSLHQEEGVSYAYVLPRKQRDHYATYELLKTLERGNVEIRKATKGFMADGHRYKAGTYVLLTDQPYGRWLQDLMKIWDYPSLEECSDCQPYDVTAHTLWMMFGVDVDNVKNPFQANLKKIPNVQPRTVRMPAAPGRNGAYLVRPASYGVDHVLSALQRKIVPTFRASQRFKAGGHQYPKGTVVVPATPRARLVLKDQSTATGLKINAVKHAPRVSGIELKPGTRVGLFRGIGNMPGGWMMWLMDQYDVRYNVVEAKDFDHNLRALYDTIILPHGISKDDIVKGLSKDKYPQEFAWAYGVGEAGWKKLKNFVENGGTLLAFGNSVATAKDLVDLPIKGVIPPRSREVNIPGSQLAQKFNRGNPVAWGMPAKGTVWFRADQAYEVTDSSKASVASSYPKQGDIVLSGFGAGEDVLRGTSNVISFDVGKGKVVTYGSEVLFRTWPRNALKLMFNPMYNGPAKTVNKTQFGNLQTQFAHRMKQLKKN